MNDHPRRMLVVAVVSASVVVMGAATFETAAVAIRNEFGISTQVMTIASAVPAAFGALMVFVAGMLSTRIDWFTLVRWSSWVTVGTLLVAAAAPTLAVLTIGRAVGGMSIAVLMVSGLGILQQGYREERSRARAFGVLAATPGVLVPLAVAYTATLTDWVSWRAALLVLAGVIAGVALLSGGLPSLQTTTHSGGTGESPGLEWGTPIGAGIALATLIGAFIAMPLSINAAVACAAICVVATAATALLWRRSSTPGLDLGIFRQPGMGWIMVATSLTVVVNFAFFGTLWLQSQPGASTTTTALALTIPQLAGIAGGIAGGRLAARFGPYPVAIPALAAGAAGGLLFMAMDADSSAIWVIVAVTVTLTATLTATGPITQIFMGRVPPGQEGSAAAWRTAVRALTTSAGGVLVIIVAAGVYRGSVATSLEQQNVPSQTAEAVAADVQRRTELETIIAQYQLPDQVITDLVSVNPRVRQAARADAMGTAGAFAIGTNGLAAVALLIAYRRERVRGSTPPARPLTS